MLMEEARMKRNWLVIHVVLVLLLSISVFGCAGKKPATTASDLPVTETAPPEPADVTPPATPSTELDATPDPWAGDLQQMTMKAIEEGLLGEVYFDFDKWELKPRARERLARNARFLNEHAQFVVTIEGHCDERGTNEYNIGLGERRANAARDYLASLGVARSRLRIISYGEERPVCSQSNESCWQRNRRSYFALTGRS
jgi:peptidoglycan-associated lipoprotein